MIQTIDPHILESFRSYTTEYAAKGSLAIFLLLCFWLAAKLSSHLIHKLPLQKYQRQPLVSLMTRLSHCLWLMTGLITALGTVGVDVSALVAGLGLTGFALGFALKDALSNVLAGVLVLIYHPFTLKDEIETGDAKGRVIEINLRYTVLEQAGQKIMIPNASLFKNTIKISTQG